MVTSTLAGPDELAFRLSPPAEAVDRASDELRTQWLTGWTDLTLQSTLTTGVPGISRYTFTYWAREDEAR